MKRSKRNVIESVELSKIDLPRKRDRINIIDQYIKELAAAISQAGLLSPIILNKSGDRFEIVAGERRFLACQYLDFTHIDALVKEYTEEEIKIIRAIENLQRVDLTIIEEAKVYFDLHTACGMSWEAIGKKTGKSPALVKRRCDLLELPEVLINALHDGKISYSVAEQLKRIRDPDRIEYLLGIVIDNGATQNIVRQWVDEEEATIRRKASGTGIDGGFHDPLEIKPIFVACDLCVEAVELGKLVSLRICGKCQKTIKEHM